MNYEIDDVNEFIANCDADDINTIYNAIIDMYNKPRGFDENLYENSLRKLHGKWNTISKKEEEQIIKIANRF